MNANLPFLLGAKGLSTEDLFKICNQSTFEDVKPILQDIYGRSYSDQLSILFDKVKKSLGSVIYDSSIHTADDFLEILLKFASTSEKFKAEKKELDKLTSLQKMFKGKKLERRHLETALKLSGTLQDITETPAISKK